MIPNNKLKELCKRSDCLDNCAGALDCDYKLVAKEQERATTSLIMQHVVSEEEDDESDDVFVELRINVETWQYLKRKSKGERAYGEPK